MNSRASKNTLLLCHSFIIICFLFSPNLLIAHEFNSEGDRYVDEEIAAAKMFVRGNLGDLYGLAVDRAVTLEVWMEESIRAKKAQLYWHEQSKAKKYQRSLAPEFKTAKSINRDMFSWSSLESRKHQKFFNNLKLMYSDEASMGHAKKRGPASVPSR
ncbi:MAG: hypothetical protein ISR65_08050 [Bacteriovoracaceae bacterium]|nr:hypothetical protein [Bacteriovoracaceae bacterium]